MNHRRRWRNTTAAVLLLAASGLARAAPFTPGNLVIYRVGDGTGPLASTGNPAFLDEYAPGGSLVQSVPMPVTVTGSNRRLVASGAATAEGQLSRSADGRFLVATGYDASIPYFSALPGTASNTVYRTIARVTHTGAVDTSTFLQDFANGGSPRSAATADGTGFWVTGSTGGVRYAPFGTTTISTQLNSTETNLRQANVFDGQLYVSSGSTVTPPLSAVGSGLPTTTGQILNSFPGLPATGLYYGFFLADLDATVPGNDTLYVADDTAGLVKFSLVGGNWTNNGIVGTDADDYRGLTASASGSSVTMFAIRKAQGTAGGGELVSLTDSSGYNGAFAGAPVLRSTAAANTAFRGIALAPFSGPDLIGELTAPATGTVGGVLTCRFSVKNIGNVATAGFTSIFYLPGSLAIVSTSTPQGVIEVQDIGEYKIIHYTTNAGLAPGASATATVRVSAATPGTYTVPPELTSVDDQANVVEVNESNNRIPAAVSIVISGPPPVAPAITSHPASLTIESGNSATLSVTASGIPAPSFQWYLGNTGDTSNPVGGAVSNTFTTPALTTNTSYWVRASNTEGHADSNTATVGINLLVNGSFEIPVVAGDILSVYAPDATTMTGWTVSQGDIEIIRPGYWSGTDGFQSLDVSGVSAGAFYQDVSGLEVGGTYRLEFDLSGNPYTDGEPIKRLNVTAGPVVSEFDFDVTPYHLSSGPVPDMGWQRKSLDFVAPGGTARIDFRSLNGSSRGPALDHVTLVRTNDPPVYTAPSITGHPAGQMIASGTTAMLSVTSSGIPAPTFQWYRGMSGDTTNPISGANSPGFTTPALTATTSYWVRASNTAGSADSNTATINVISPLPDLAVSISGPTSAHTADTFEYVVTVTNVGNSAAPEADLIISDQFKQLEWLSYQFVGGSNIVFSTPLHGIVDGTFVTLALQPGEQDILTLRMRVPTGAAGTAVISCNVDSIDQIAEANEANNQSEIETVLLGPSPGAPVFITQPANQTINNGSTAAFTVAASGNPTPSFQWYRGASGDTSNPVSGANSPGFTTPALTSSTSYWVRATNTAGTADSNTAAVTVNPPSTNANLSAIAVSQGSLSPAFGPFALVYTVSVPNSVSNITITPTVADPTASVQVAGIPVTSSMASGSIALEIGANVIPVLVTAQDAATTRTYSLTVTRLDPLVVITDPASNLTAVSAQLGGTVNPRGSATVYFEYGTTLGYGAVTAGQNISGNSSIPVSAILTGISGGTLYHYRVVANGADGLIAGNDVTFTTALELPVAATGSPAAITATGATLVGAVSSNGVPVEAHFEFGLTTLYGGTTAIQNFPAGNNLRDVLAPVTGLISGASYHCRIVATSVAGTTYGADVVFVATAGTGTGTGSPTSAPSVTTLGTAAVDTDSAELLGSAIPNDGTTVVRFEFGTTAGYGRLTDILGIGNGNTPAAVSLPAAGLVPGTLYHYRLTATNSLGTTLGADATFTTGFLTPGVVTGSAAALSTTSASVAGTVRARNADSQVFFDYGSNPAILNNSVTAAPAVISGDTVTPVSAVLPDLMQGTTYYYRVRAVNTGGTGTGAVKSFDVGVLSGLFQRFPDAIFATDHQGAVTVNLTPGGIGGGWRFVGEQSWRESGIAATGLASGDRVIEYRPSPGYVKPPDETVVVVNGADPIAIDRAYTPTAVAGSGGLTVTLKPEALADAGVPGETRAQWRLFGESDAQWKDSGVNLTDLASGDYVIECKPVAGRTTPPPVTAVVSDGATTAATITYFITADPVGTPPQILTFDTLSTRQDRPYAYVGQITSDVGASTGFVVRPRVVATAGHVVFDDGTLAATTGLQWLFQRDRGVHEPVPRIPRGFYLLAGYAAQRAADNSPGTSTPESQNLDAAALYFSDDAGRAGFSGYLASDSTVNEFLASSALKTLVGYPVDGIAPADQGKMHATPLADVAFSSAFGQTYTTPDIRSVGGNSGGPLCVQDVSGVYYPAAIYLGGTAQTVVRAIDSSVVNLFGFAEASANTDTGSTGGAITQSGTTPIGTPSLGAIKVNIEPAAARAAGAGWRIQAQAAYLAGGTQVSDLSPNEYTVRFASVSGFVPPASQPLVIQAGQLTTITFTYEQIIPPPVINSPNTLTATRGQPLAYQVTAANTPTFFTLLGVLPGGTSFNENTGLISGTTQEAGNFPITIGATNSGGADTRVVNLTVRPVLAAQSLTIPYLQAASYQIVSSESGAGVSYSATGLPDGLALDFPTGLITGIPTVPGVFSVPVSVSKSGASATANITFSITGTAPVITQQPPASKSIEYGVSTTLTVAASGLPEPTYQWYRGASGVTANPVAGATSATFTTPAVTANTSYWARASSISGSADSTETAIQVLLSSNAKLASLTTSGGAPGPAFNPAITSYSLAVPYATTGITLTPTVQVAQSTLTIAGNPSVSGDASANLPLAVGENSIPVAVTAGDGVTTITYTILVTRAQSPVVTTAAATLATDVSATLNGLAVPNSQVDVHFEYGMTTGYGSTTASQLLSGSAGLPVQAAITGLVGNTTYHYRIVAVTAAGNVAGDDMSFTTSLARPLAATGSPAGVSTSQATLIGAVNPRGLAADTWFEYGTTPALGSVTPTQNIPAGSGVVDVLAVINGLTPSATYYYRIVATSVAGTGFGDTVIFQAISGGGSGDGIVDAPPTVTTGGVADITINSAVLLGVVNPNDGTTFVFFEYGPTNGYGLSTASEGIGNGNEPANVTLDVSGLVPGAVYHYRLVASNSLGSVNGADATFTSGYFPPIASTGTAVALSSTSATVNGSVRARGTSADVWFDYGTDGVTFPNSVRASQLTVSGDLETPVSVDLTNLNGAQTYYYRTRAEGAGGTGTGDPLPLRVGALLGFNQQFTRVVPAGDYQGQVTVNLLPAGTGGWRFVGETQWRASGATVGGLTSGEREIDFQPVPGQIQPQREIVGVVSGEPVVTLERTYYETDEAGTGVLRVLLKPESLTGPGVPVASRAQWRIDGGSDPAWLDSGAEITGLPGGSYLVECKAVSGKNTPVPANYQVVGGETTTATITYFPASAPSLNPPGVVPFPTVSSVEDLPYAYVGQIRSGTGSHSGFVVKPRVVATVAQAVFDDGTLAATSGTQWLLQRDKGHYEPKPQTPRGFYIFAGYDARRATESTPGTLAIESQDLNVASLYFTEDAGRGGFSGFLASDDSNNEFLQSSALKTIVGYPVSGIAAASQGRMHFTPYSSGAFTLAYGHTYTSPTIRGIGGMAGGPLCVRYQEGNYFPAGILVGGTMVGAVRSFDSTVIDILTRAEVSGNGGDNNTGGGITHSSFASIGATSQPGALEVTILPAAARNAGAGWRLKPETSYRPSGNQKAGLNAGSYKLQLTTVAGFQAPAQQSVTVNGGQLRQVTFTYAETNAAPSIGNVANLTIDEDTSSGPISVSVSDPDNANNSLVLTGSSSNTSLIPNANIVFGGSGSNRTVTLTPAANQSGSATITLTVSDGDLTDTDTFVVTVTPVNDAPTISGIAAQSIPVNTNTGAISFTVGDIETAASSLTLTRTTSNSSLVPLSAIVFGGSGANRNVTITPTANQLGSATVTVTVSDGGLTATRMFAVTVTGTTIQTWRFANFGSTANTGSAANTADADGDGSTNIDEYAAGTNPNNGSDQFKVLTVTRTGGTCKVTVAGKASRTYVLERRDALVSGPWTGVATVGPLGSNGTIMLADPASPAGSSFYRVQVSVP